MSLWCLPGYYCTFAIEYDISIEIYKFAFFTFAVRILRTYCFFTDVDHNIHFFYGCCTRYLHQNLKYECLTLIRIQKALFHIEKVILWNIFVCCCTELHYQTWKELGLRQKYSIHLVASRGSKLLLEIPICPRSENFMKNIMSKILLVLLYFE